MCLQNINIIPLYSNWFLIGFIFYYITIIPAGFLMLCRSILLMIKINFVKGIEDQSCMYICTYISLFIQVI